MFQLKRYYWLAAALVVAALVLTACPAPVAAPATGDAAAAPTEAPTEAAAAPAADGEMARNETVVFDIDGGKVTDPTLWNQFVPGSRRDHGYHQAVYEPLFILNYQDGQFIPCWAKALRRMIPRISGRLSCTRALSGAMANP